MKIKAIVVSVLLGMSTAQAANGLKIMTLNLWGQDNYDRIPSMAAYLNSHPDLKPDFIVYQEVIHYGQGGNTAAFLGSLLGHQTQAHSELAISSRHAFAAFRTYDLKAYSPKTDFPRFVIAGDFIVDGVGKVRVIDVHFAYQEFDHELRRAQFIEAAEWVRSLQQQDPADHILLAGDFNSEPQWPEMVALRQWFAQLLPFEDHNSTEPTWADLPDLSKAIQKIDYIFSYSRPKTDKLSFSKENILWKSPLPATERVLREKKTSFIWPTDHRSVLQTYGQP
jgi:endonuclease/exonuclease/phosphatase family metal-dependent hydrolase